MTDWLTVAISFFSLSVALGTRVSRPARLARSLENLRALQEIYLADLGAVEEYQLQLAVDEVRGDLRRYQTRYGRWEVGLPYALGLVAYLSCFWISESTHTKAEWLWLEPVGSVVITGVVMVLTMLGIKWWQRRSRRTAGVARDHADSQDVKEQLSPRSPVTESRRGAGGGD